MKILGQLVEKQAPNWDLWSRHFARYRQKKKLQLQLNNHGCRTDKYQQSFFFPFAPVMILANLSLVCFNSELVQIWAETKKTAMTMLHYALTLKIWAETKKQPWLCYITDNLLDLICSILQGYTIQELIPLPSIYRAQQIETEVRRGGRGGHSPWERGCMAWRACRAYRRCWAAHGDTDGEGHLVTTSAWRRARPLRLYGKPIWGDGAKSGGHLDVA